MNALRLLVASLWIVLVPYITLAAPNERPVASPTFSLELYESSVLPEEPAFLQVRIHNETDTDLTVRSPALQHMHGNSGLLWRNGEKTGNATPPLRSFHMGQKNPLILRPGESERMMVNLAHSGLPKVPGAYALQFRYGFHDSMLRFQGVKEAEALSLWQGSVSSPEVVLTIEPLTGFEAEAYAIVAASAARAVFDEPVFIFGSPDAETILTKFPASRYAKYCLYYSGIRNLHDDPIKGIAYLRRLIAVYPAHPLADSALMVIARDLADRRLLDEAENELHSFFASYPDSERRRSAEALRDGIARRKGAPAGGVPK